MCDLCCERRLEIKSVVNCDMERPDYQVLQENDLSRDLNVVNVDNRVEMTFAHLQFEKLPERVSGWPQSDTQLRGSRKAQPFLPLRRWERDWYDHTWLIMKSTCFHQTKYTLSLLLLMPHPVCN